MTVHFIGAGPGAAGPHHASADAICSRAARSASMPARSCRPSFWRYCPAGARIVDTAPMTLDEIEAEYVAAHAAGHDVARLHSGDLSVFSAVAEQIRRLERHGIPYTLTPGVPAFAAAAALLGRELTVPEIAQSLVLTRVSGPRLGDAGGRAPRRLRRDRRDARASTSLSRRIDRWSPN